MATTATQVGSKGCAFAKAPITHPIKKATLVGTHCLATSASSVQSSAGSLCPPTRSAWPRNHFLKVSVNIVQAVLRFPPGSLFLARRNAHYSRIDKLRQGTKHRSSVVIDNTALNFTVVFTEQNHAGKSLRRGSLQEQNGAAAPGHSWLEPERDPNPYLLSCASTENESARSVQAAGQLKLQGSAHDT